MQFYEELRRPAAAKLAPEKVRSNATGYSFRAVQSSAVRSIVFLPNDNVLAVCYDTGDWGLWDWRTRKEIHRTTVSAGVPLQSIAASRDGLLAVGGGVRQRETEVHIYRVRDKRVEFLRTISQPDSVRCLCFSPSGRWLAVGDFSSNARVWDVAHSVNDDLKPTVLGAGHSVSDIAYSLDEKTVAATAGVKIILWHADSGEEMATIDAGEELEGIASIEAGMVTASEEGPIRLWRVAKSGEEFELLGPR